MGESFGIKTPAIIQNPEGREKLKPLSKDYFDIQLQFAEAVSQKSGIPLENALFKYTNLFARLSFGTLDELDENDPAWQKFAHDVSTQTDRSEYVYSTYLNAPQEKPPAQPIQFGCFRADPVEEDGLVTFHFKNTEYGKSPFSPDQIEARKQELKNLFTEIKKQYPHAKIVKGGSWLYDKEEYRSLFPASYSDSRIVQNDNRFFQGMSRWGQFLDKNGNVRSDSKERFLEALKRVDAEHLADAFPIPRYKVEAPVQDFYDFYGIRDEEVGA
ncbi:MAG: hypothetical protein JWM46_484 [Candidatus Kaiserbacteria bacterium]|nr:hypothetical protein [Candidatus Kaiserbacteria bacterium]